MPLSEFQRRKLAQMFSVLDSDDDGRIDQADFFRRVDSLAARRGWPEDSPQYRGHLRFAFEEWRNLSESADTDADDGITRDEFLRCAEIFLDDRDAVRAYAHGDAQLLFDAMDADLDGKITTEEYRSYLEAYGADPSHAELFFEHADVDEDGLITRDEMTHAVQEFLISEDPASPGNYLFGPPA